MDQFSYCLAGCKCMSNGMEKNHQLVGGRRRRIGVLSGPLARVTLRTNYVRTENKSIEKRFAITGKMSSVQWRQTLLDSVF